MSLRIEQNWKCSNKTFPHTLCVVVTTSDERSCLLSFITGETFFNKAKNKIFFEHIFFLLALRFRSKLKQDGNISPFVNHILSKRKVACNFFRSCSLRCESYFTPIKRSWQNTKSTKKMLKIPLLLYQRSFTTFRSRTALLLCLKTLFETLFKMERNNIIEQRRQDFTHRKIVKKTVLNTITLIIQFLKCWKLRF